MARRWARRSNQQNIEGSILRSVGQPADIRNEISRIQEAGNVEQQVDKDAFRSRTTRSLRLYRITNFERKYGHSIRKCQALHAKCYIKCTNGIGILPLSHPPPLAPGSFPAHAARSLSNVLRECQAALASRSQDRRSISQRDQRLGHVNMSSRTVRSGNLTALNTEPTLAHRQLVISVFLVLNCIDFFRDYRGEGFQ